MHLFKWLGIDRAVFFSILTKIWSAAAGLVTLFLVSHLMSPELQGYYYTFCSLAALVVFAELGITVVIVTFASHEMAKLSWSPSGVIVGDQASKERLRSLIFFSIRWIIFSSIIFVMLLSIFGMLFFRSIGFVNVSQKNIELSWLILILGTALNVILAAMLAVLEGCDKVVDVVIFRLCQSVCSAITIWIVLTFGGNLFALALGSVVSALLGLTLFLLKFHKFVKDICRSRSGFLGLDWRQEIWPFQWKLAISSISGYLTFQLINPILLVSSGPVAAGKMGMTMQVIAAINSVAIVWITTKIPMYGRMIAEGNMKSLDRIFFRGFLQSMALMLVSSAGVWYLVHYLQCISSPYSDRVLPPSQFALLLVTGIASHVVASEAAYLRANKSEPFMLVSILQGILIACLAVSLIPGFGLEGAVYSYMMPILSVGLMLGTLVFFRNRNLVAQNSTVHFQVGCESSKNDS